MSPTASAYLDNCREILTAADEQLNRLQMDWEVKKNELDDYEIGPASDKITILCIDIKAAIEKLNSYQTS